MDPPVVYVGRAKRAVLIVSFLGCYVFLATSFWSGRVWWTQQTRRIDLEESNGRA